MKVYDPRLDTEPGAHPDDERYRVQTKNPMLLLTDFQRAAGFTVDWAEVVRLANVCDEEIAAPTVVDVVQGGRKTF